MNKNIWIIANWKSNKNLSEALNWVAEVGPKVMRRDSSLESSGRGLKVVVCPAFSALEEVRKAVKIGNFSLMVGSQDLSPFGMGAYTGEENAQTLKDFVELAILGHSERRQNFSETDEMVGKKVEQAVSENIIPLVCVQSSETPVPDKCKLVAYEPVFAIGSGNPDTPENANKVAKQLKELYFEDLEVLYGGSVNSENCKQFVDQENISGLLIGKASLDAQEFLKIINTLIS